jgi:hypothetical protein
MGALENLLPEKIKRARIYPGEVEFVLPYLEALEAIGIATANEIAILGVDAHEVSDGGIWTINLHDGSAAIKYAGNWRAFVQQLNTGARDWVTAHRLGERYGYLLTSTSQEEFDHLRNRSI